MKLRVRLRRLRDAKQKERQVSEKEIITMKKIIAILLAGLLAVLMLTGCTKSKEQASLGSGQDALIAGGWQASSAPTLTEEQKALFEKATATITGVTAEPLAYLGSQVVSGTNHAFFCKSEVSVEELKNGTFYSIVYIYEDLQGNAEMTGIRSFTPFGEEDENAANGQPAIGGWSAPESQEEGLAALNKALEGSNGNPTAPVLVIGQQVVAGMNYCVLCKITPLNPREVPGYAFVTVYRDLQGNAEITSTQPVSLPYVPTAD